VELRTRDDDNLPCLDGDERVVAEVGTLALKHIEDVEVFFVEVAVVFLAGL
jgi:hypothetical protein